MSESLEEDVPLCAVCRAVRVLGEVKNTALTGVVLGGGVEHGCRRAMTDTPSVTELSGGGAPLYGNPPISAMGYMLCSSGEAREYISAPPSRPVST